MKKILAFLMAATTCFCAFTACGDKKDSDDEKTNKKSSSDKDDKSEELDIYADVFMDMIDAAKDEDVSKLLRCTLPDLTMDAIENTDSLDVMTESMGSISSLGLDSISDVEAIAAKECDEDIVEGLEKLYSVYSNLFIIMEENDLTYDDIASGNIDESVAEEILEPASQLVEVSDVENLDVDISVNIKEAKMVTFKYEGTKEEAVAYRVDGEDWKIDTVGKEILKY
ncbi:MAG: hypothetical protein J6B01_07570 [Ruminococcus sp.]|nr:hypothetical protein [Ruminococcus sp.]